MVIVKNLSEEDIPSVISLSSKIFDPILQGLDDDEDKKIWWENFRKSGLLLGAYDEAILVGFIFFFQKDESAKNMHCWMAGVDESFREKGILTKLMNSGLKELNEKGINEVTVNTIKEKNPQMYAYLIKYGFEKYKEEEKDWHEEKTTKCFFRKHL